MAKRGSTITVSVDNNSLAEQRGEDVATPATVRGLRAFDAVAREVWAIERDMLRIICDVARGEGEGPEALSARLGRPLQNAQSVEMRNGVAVLPIVGPIFRYANMFTEISGATSLDVLARDFQAAVDAPDAKAIVLNIDSPGGQAAGIAEFADLVRAADKPVVAYVGNRGQSAAYWIASAADRVVLNRTAQVGSIGAVLQVVPDQADGSYQFVSSQSPQKRLDPASEAGAAAYQAQADRLAQVFVEDVAAHRGVSVDTVLSNFGRGGSLQGADAVAAGMADALGTLESTIAGLAGNTGATRMTASTKGAQPAAAEQPVIDIAYLEASHPALLEQIRTAAFNTGADTGAANERERIRGVWQVPLIQAHPALLEHLMFDGKSTAAEAALQVLAAEKESRADTLAAWRGDGARPVADAAPALVPLAGATIEERTKAKWDASAEIRAEFGKYETYLAYARAAESGAVKILTKPSTKES